MPESRPSAIVGEEDALVAMTFAQIRQPHLIAKESETVQFWRPPGLSPGWRLSWVWPGDVLRSLPIEPNGCSRDAQLAATRRRHAPIE